VHRSRHARNLGCDGRPDSIMELKITMEKYYKDRNWLFQKYANENLGICKIGDMLGASSSTISNWLHKLNIPVRKPGRHLIERYREKAHNWNGGKTISQGYLCEMVDFDHPAKDKNKYVRRHRLVVENKIGRFLNKREMVHHINTIRLDNKIENLMVFPNPKEHSKFHRFLEKLSLYLLGITTKRPIFDFTNVLVFDSKIKELFNGRE